MTFLAMRQGEQVDGNREGFQQFLTERQLTVQAFHESAVLLDLFDEESRPLELDGNPTALAVSAPDAKGPIMGGISHAHLGPEELEFIFDLCDAAGWFIINQQGGGDTPMCLLLASGGHGPEDFWEQDLGYVTIPNAKELGAVLANSFDAFLNFRERALGPRGK